jgi:copper(I)-binding protein
VKRILLSLLLLTTGAQAAPFTVTDAWFRALPGHLPAGGYFTAYNGTTHNIAITDARSDACGMLMLHQSTNKGGMSGMNMLDRVPVPAGGTVKFAPGGYHLMCDDPSAKMKPGARVGVTLILSDGTAVTTAFTVRGAAGR